jgi:sporulation protein YlmC with PRC-barrel domain
MISKRTVMGAAAMTLVSGIAVAQTTPPASTAPNTSKWMTQFPSGQWQASKLKGLNVYNNNNEKIGDINELVVDQSGKVQAAVIGVGGFLGIGEHDVAVPFNELKWVNEPPRSASRSDAPPADRERTTASRDGGRTYPDHAVLNMTKDQLKAAPEFKYTK